MIDNSDGADVYEVMIFNDDTKKIVFFAHENSQDLLLQEIHQCYSTIGDQIALLSNHLPSDLFKRDCLAGGHIYQQE